MPVQAHLPADMLPTAEQLSGRETPCSPSKPAQRRKHSQKRSLEVSNATTSHNKDATQPQAKKAKRSQACASGRTMKGATNGSTPVDEADDLLPLSGATVKSVDASNRRRHPATGSKPAKHLATAVRAPGAVRGSKKGKAKPKGNVADNASLPKLATSPPRPETPLEQFMQEEARDVGGNSPEQSARQQDPEAAAEHQAQQQSRANQAEMEVPAEPSPMEVAADASLPSPRSSPMAGQPSSRALESPLHSTDHPAASLRPPPAPQQGAASKLVSSSHPGGPPGRMGVNSAAKAGPVHMRVQPVHGVGQLQASSAPQAAACRRSDPAVPPHRKAATIVPTGAMLKQVSLESGQMLQDTFTSIEWLSFTEALLARLSSKLVGLSMPHVAP